MSANSENNLTKQLVKNGEENQKLFVEEDEEENENILSTNNNDEMKPDTDNMCDLNLVQHDSSTTNSKDNNFGWNSSLKTPLITNYSSTPQFPNSVNNSKGPDSSELSGSANENSPSFTEKTLQPSKDHGVQNKQSLSPQHTEKNEGNTVEVMEVETTLTQNTQNDAQLKVPDQSSLEPAKSSSEVLQEVNHKLDRTLPVRKRIIQEENRSRLIIDQIKSSNNVQHMEVDHSDQSENNDSQKQSSYALEQFSDLESKTNQLVKMQDCTKSENTEISQHLNAIEVKSENREVGPDQPKNAENDLVDTNSSEHCHRTKINEISHKSVDDQSFQQQSVSEKVDIINTQLQKSDDNEINNVGFENYKTAIQCKESNLKLDSFCMEKHQSSEEKVVALKSSLGVSSVPLNVNDLVTLGDSSNSSVPLGENVVNEAVIIKKCSDDLNDSKIADEIKNTESEASQIKEELCKFKEQPHPFKEEEFQLKLEPLQLKEESSQFKEELTQPEKELSQSKEEEESKLRPSQLKEMSTSVEELICVNDNIEKSTTQKTKHDEIVLINLEEDSSNQGMETDDIEILSKNIKTLPEKPLIREKINETSPSSSERITTSNRNNEIECIDIYSSSDDDFGDKRDEDSKFDTVIRVGKKYQADVPDFKPIQKLSGEDRTNPKHKSDSSTTVTLWSSFIGDKSPDQEELNTYIEKAKKDHGYREDQALGLLYYHKYDFKVAYSELPLYSPSEADWTQGEKTRFEKNIYTQKKNFNQIQVGLPKKSVKELVSYYYLWKNEMKKAEREKERANEKRKSDRICKSYLNSSRNKRKKN